MGKPFRKQWDIEAYEGKVLCSCEDTYYSFSLNSRREVSELVDRLMDASFKAFGLIIIRIPEDQP